MFYIAAKLEGGLVNRNGCFQMLCKLGSEPCVNMLELGRVRYIDYTETLNISNEMLMNEKLCN